MDRVWVFNGEDSPIPAGVFSQRASAEEWIRRHRLTGMLTAYPMDKGLYDWAVEQEVFKPKRDDQKTSWFIGRFTSASLEHYHFEDGKC